MDMRNLILAAAIAAVTAGVPLMAARQGPSPSASDVAAALQRKYDSLRDFSADFTHAYEGGVLRKKVSERGTLMVKKPGKMRWNYTTPEEKVFVSDGRRIYLYVPADKQVTVTAVPDQDQATTAVLFLAGKGNLTRDFAVSFVPGAPADKYKLRLEPKQVERDYEWLELLVDRATMRIVTLHAGDRQGGQSAFLFTNFKENTGLADKVFEFRIPRGVDVITAGSDTR
jgi:outer membrane lipoprotein carrier protein